MEIEKNATDDLIEKSVIASNEAVKAIQDGDRIRCQTSMELRDMQLSLHEDGERMRGLISEFKDQVDQKMSENSKLLDAKLEKAKESADQAFSSVLMVKDVETLNKKVSVLQDSVTQANKAQYNYEKQVDMKDLMEQVSEMVYRTERKEKEVLGGKAANEELIETVFRSAIEGLYSLQSGNPKLMAEAKELAGELRVFRDAAYNKNFYTMISKTGNTPPSKASSAETSEPSTSASACPSSSASESTSSQKSRK